MQLQSVSASIPCSWGTPQKGVCLGFLEFNSIKFKFWHQELQRNRPSKARTFCCACGDDR
ncbi:hypothetical protein MKW92_013743, partial [Papaver armeniacum]